MGFGSQALFAEAVLFLESDQVVKEMLFSEFEAILDGVVGAPECAGKTYQAAYVTVGQRLRISSVVLFIMQFDHEGQVKENWNIPLRMLADEADAGPDLGHGAIKVCTEHTCKKKQYKKHLWSPGTNILQVLGVIKAAIEKNRLGIYAGEDRRAAASDSAQTSGTLHLDNELLQQLTSGLEAKYKQQLSEQAKAADDKLARIEQERDELRDIVQALENNIQVLEAHNKQHVDAIISKYKSKVNRQLEEAASRLSDEMNAKDLELHYSRETERQLKEELEQIKQKGSNQPIVESAKAYMDQLQQLGVSMVVTHPELPSEYLVQPEELEALIDNPKDFIHRLLKREDIKRAS